MLLSHVYKGSFPLPIDFIPGATAAWGTRRLRRAYNGHPLEILRSSDSTAQDVPFSGDRLNLGVLTTFVGASTGTVRTLYDQSTAVTARPLTQTTAADQPVLVSSGTLLTTIGGQPSLSFDGTSQFLLNTASFSNYIANNAGTILVVFLVDAINTANANTYDNDAVWGDTQGFVGLHLHSTTPDARTFNFDTTDDKVTQTIVTSTPYVHIWRHGSGNLDSFLNTKTAATVASGNTGNLLQQIRMGKNFSTAFFDGHIPEMMMWNVALSDVQIHLLGASVAHHYGIPWS